MIKRFRLSAGPITKAGELVEHMLQLRNRFGDE
jgi:hypothetical protein